MPFALTSASNRFIVSSGPWLLRTVISPRAAKLRSAAVLNALAPSTMSGRPGAVLAVDRAAVAVSALAGDPILRAMSGTPFAASGVAGRFPVPAGRADGGRDRERSCRRSGAAVHAGR